MRYPDKYTMAISKWKKIGKKSQNLYASFIVFFPIKLQYFIHFYVKLHVQASGQ